MIEIRELSKSFGTRKVLDKVSFEVGASEVVFVLGKSGVGKSVLLKNIVGILEPDSGSVRIESKTVTSDRAVLKEIRKTCGMVFQFPALIDSLSVKENLKLGLRGHQTLDSEASMNEKAISTLKLCGLPESLLEKFPADLSFTMQKRVSVARALALDPKFLLFDEPTTGLDPVLTAQTNELIRHLAKVSRVGIIVVSHDMTSAIHFAHKIILLEEGRVAFSGGGEEFRKSKVPLAVSFLKEAHVF